MSDSPQYIFILCSEADYQQALTLGEFRHPSLETEGFIHASIPRQLTRVANKYYKGTPGLCLMAIDTTRLTAPLKWEAISTGDLYPHIYGTVPADAIIQTHAIQPNPEGAYVIDPEPLQSI